MKQINNVRNTIENGSGMTRLKSRIVSASSRVWLAFAPILLVVFGLFGVNENAWAGNVVFNAPASASPTEGGSVSVSPSNQQTVWSAGIPFTSLYYEVEATFTYSASANTTAGYVFKGWSTSSTSNSGDTSSSFSKKYKQKGKAGTVTYNADEYYAIFARLTARSTAAMAFGTKLVGAEWSDGTTKSVTIDYVHAGKITATITGTNKTEFSLSNSSSSQSKEVVSNNTNSETNSTITVYFKPTSTGNKSATLTISSNNNLTSISISLTGTGQATVTPTDTCKLADSYYVGATALDLNKLWTSNSPATKRYKVESFTATGINNDNAITPSITGTSLSLGQAGDLTISMAQSATTGYYKDSTVKVIHILKHKPTFEWNKNNTAYYHNTSIANIFSTNNKDCNYTITSSDALVATVSNNTLYILSKTSPSKATFTVTQEENYYWEGKTSYYDVTPTNPSNHLTMNYSQALYNDGSITSKTGTTQWEKDYVIIGDAVWGGLNWDDKYIIIHFLGIPDKMSFKFKTTSDDATKVEWYVDESSNGTNWTRRPWSNNGRDDAEWSDKQEFSLDKNSRYVKICYSGNFAGCFQNIKITELKKFEPSVETLDFETQQIKVARPNKTFDLDYANIGHNVTLSVNDDAFTVSPTTITSIGGEKSGTYTPITVSYSTENVHKSAADAKITIQDELGNKKYVYLQAETKKKKQTLNWISKYNVDQPSIPVNKEITGAATCSPLTDVRYSSSDPTVIEILDEGRSFRALIADSAATITASQAGNAEWDTISISKRFKTTNKTVQVILWNQNLTNFTTENTSSGLQAKVYLEDPKTGTLTYSAERTLLLTYTSGNENVVTVDGTTLLIQAKGTTTLTASVDGDEDYEGTSAVLPVAVNEPIAGCPDENLPVSIIGTDMVENGEIVLFNMSTDKPALSKTISINTEKGVPGELHFSTKGTKFAKIWFSGEVQVRESSDNVHWSGVIWHKKPSVSDNYSPESIVLQHDTRYVQFTRPQGGEGYHHINNIYVTPAQFIETNLPKDKQSKDSLGFGTMEYSSSLEKVVEISYANAKSNLTLAVDEANKENILLSASTIYISECGGKGTYNLTVTCTPQSATPINATITITDINAGKSTTIRVVADVIRAAQHIEWTPTQTSFYTVQTEELNAQLPKLTDKNQTVKLTSKNTNIVSFSGTTASIHKNGTVTLCASHPGTPDLNKADTVKHDFTFNLTPTTISTLPTIQGTITTGTIASAVVLENGEAKNTVNNGAVNGSFKVVSPATLTAGTYDLTVEFKPDDENIYSRCTATLENVTVNKLATLNVPVALSFCAGESETFHGETFDTAGEYDVLAEGATRDTVYKVTVTVLQPTTGTDNKEITVGDAEYWNGIDLSGYAVGSHSVEFHTDNAAGCDSTVTLTLTVKAVAPTTNTFTNATGDGEWETDDNWSTGTAPSTSEPDIIVAGQLVIDEVKTVGSMTIMPTGGVTIIEGGLLTVNKATPDQTGGYGDLRVAENGALALNDVLQVRDFTIDASLGNSSNAGTSGQVSGEVNLHVNRNAYFQMSFDPDNKISYGWYDFTVPFEVEVLNGIYDDHMNKLTNGVDYLVMNFSEARRASSGKGWGSFTGTMQPGRIYSIGFDETRVWNTFIFKKKSGSITLSDGSYDVEYSNAGAADDRGWNGLGNGTLQHRELTGMGSRKVQVYNHSADNYSAYDADEKAYAVGTAFFLQADEYLSSISLTTTDGSKALHAPKYSGRSLDEFRLTLTAEGADRYTDRMWVSASEEATGEYVIGRDLIKMGAPTDSKVAQMWAINNDLRLCDIEMPMMNDKAQCTLGLFAPQAQTYTLAVDQAPEDATLYLTYNGRVIWSLTASPYTIDLTQGMTEGYGLRIEARHNAPQVATGVDEVDVDQNGNRKVLIDNMLYILTPEGAMYSVTGEKVK